MSKRTPAYWKGTNVVLDVGWGDNGKGKFVDIGSQYADLVVRWAGGPNAGHTINNEFGEFKFHLMPSGIFNSLCVLGDTVIIDPDILIGEIDELNLRGFPINESNLLISADASLIFDWHKRRDVLSEAARGGKMIGTTGRGIGPTYADRTDRTGLKIHHLYEPDFEKRLMREFVWQTRMTKLMEGKTHIGNLSREDFEGISPHAFNQMVRKSIGNGPYDFEKMYDRLTIARERLEPMVKNVFPIIQKVHRDGGNLLGEGAQGALLDLDLGTTPYVTSSHPTMAGFSIATGINANEVRNVYGVTRAYGARVGEGPFPTELEDETGEYIRKVGKEYGTTTGRPRRCGWFDAIITKYSVRVSGATKVALTKLDVLDELDEIKICIGYKVDGQRYDADTLPTIKPRFLYRAKPIYETMPGWEQKTSEVRSFGDLPLKAQKYALRIEDLLSTPIKFVSVGPEREATIVR